MDQEEAPPPPYSAVDPLIAPTRNGNPAQIPPRGGVSESQDASSSRTPPRPTVVPTHFTSAAGYFEERPPWVLDETRDILQHHITIYPRSQAKDFPRRPRCWATRFDEVTQQDWDTFLRYLFPPQLGLAASSQHLPRQLRAEIRRDRKDRPQETDEQRKARIAAVVAEWNECFFGNRSTQIVPVYVGEPDNAPASGLCPRCYPAATGSIEGQPSRNPNAPSPVSGQQTPSPTHWQMPPAPYHTPPIHASPYGIPYGAPTYPSPMSPNHQPPQYYPVLHHPPPQGVAPWQWNNWNYAQQQQQYPNNGISKGGSFGWISQLASQAQKYGERFSEQAQQYGDQISAQAQHYGRQVEEQALAHGRWLEEQARLHGRKAPMTAPGGHYGRPAWDNSPQHAVNVPMNPVQNTTPSPVTSVNTTSHPSPADQVIDKLKPSTERSRRVSVSSVSSESSFSSIDSISTTSNLSVSDLATVRTQLELLDDRHDRTLYDAAVELRRQLTALQASRREDKIAGRKDWRKQNQQSNNDWGRWDSPEQQERNSVDRRAMKDEMRATKKVFKDVLRRAREEQRERRRVRRRQVRQARASEGDTAKYDQPLEQQLGTLRLDGTPVVSRPATTPAQPNRVTASNASIASIESGSNPPSISRASTQDFAPAGTSKKPKPTDTSTRIKDMLRSRKAKKKQQNEDAEGESK